MASPILLSGTVSHLNRLASTSGQMNNGRGHIRTDHATTFRLNNRPVHFSGVADIAEGEAAAAAGYDKGGEFRALAVRNGSTGLIYHTSSVALMVVAGIMIGIGILMLPNVSGLLLVGGGVLIGRPAYRARQARALLLQPEAARSSVHA